MICFWLSVEPVKKGSLRRSASLLQEAAVAARIAINAAWEMIRGRKTDSGLRIAKLAPLELNWRELTPVTLTKT
jgi:hypothetical protein